ncbi:MAG: DUF4910 domain-containing protein [Parachlamydiaceae bacterium]|nr:DUF4910 domain-containing protein [Parachlamydiaceae bacterium]
MPLFARKIIEDLWIKNRNFCSSDYDACLSYFQKILPFHIYEYRSEKHDQGWEIPPKFDILTASINFEGRQIFSTSSPLQLIGLSTSFHGCVSLCELKKHLHFDSRIPDATPYHFRQNYRPWEREWGFCVTQNFYDSLQEGMYTIDIATQESPGYLSVAEVIKPGRTPYGFAFVAHLDHGGMANDDLAGVAVAVDLFERLFKQDTKFTYRLILVQEIIGSVFYLKYNRDPNILESCFLEMLGSKTPLALQATAKGNSYLEEVLEEALKLKNTPYRKGGFRDIICNDEVVWESVGIPMSSLSRFPYPEYHSDKDNPSIIDDAALVESISVLEETIRLLESSSLVCKQYSGVVGLSHPEYQLYVDPGQLAFNITVNENQKKLRNLMDLMSLIPDHIFVEKLAKSVNLSKNEAMNYLDRWQEKKLIKII